MRHENHSKGVELVYLDAYMTSPNLSDFQKILNQIMSNDLKTLILDFEEVIMIDSATIGYLFKIYKLSLSNDFKLKFIQLKENILDTLSIMGLDNLFEFYDSKELAIDSLKYE